MPDPARLSGIRVRIALLVAVVAALGVAALGGLQLASRAEPTPIPSSPASIAARPTASGGSPSAPALAGPSASVVPSASIGPTASIGPARIALVDGNGALVTVDQAGGSRATYPEPGVVFGFPAWSPDGTRVAAVGQGSAGAGVYVFTVRATEGVGEKPTVIYRSADHAPFYLYWTPDGRSVSFLTTESVDPAAIALRVVPANVKAPVEGADQGSILRRGAPLYFDWVDPRRVLLHVGVGAEAFVGQVGLDGKAIGTPLAGTGQFRSASVSRDGRYVAYVRSNPDASMEIVVDDVAQSTSNHLLGFGPGAMLFDPSGSTLATIIANKPGSESLGFPLGPVRLVNPQNGAVRPIVDGSVLAFFWAPDGRTIAAIHLLDGSQAPTVDAGGIVLAGARPTTPGEAPHAQADDANAGVTFVDVATGAVRAERRVRLAGDFVRQLLPYFDQYALSHQVWSPDGVAILLPLTSATGQDQLVAIPADGSQPRVIGDGDKGFWGP